MQDCAPALDTAAETTGYNLSIDALPYLLDASISILNQRLAERLRRIGLTLEQWRLLLITAQHGPMTIRALSKATYVPHSTIGRWLTLMEDDGLISRRTFPKDQRAVEISITPKGRRLFARAYPLARVEFESATRDFAYDELVKLTGLLTRFKENLQD
jgi:DNA-binding MarR family transcriptional regulator